MTYWFQRKPLQQKCLKELQQEKVLVTSEHQREVARMYYHDNKDTQRERNAAYNERNKEAIREKAREKRYCPACNSWTRRQTFSTHMASDKHQRNCVKIGG